MHPSRSDEHHHNQLLDTLLALLRADFVALVARLILPRLAGLWRRPEGMYEVLAHELQLELCDPEGHAATLRKHQKVMFLQDNIIAYQDQAWGDGDLFADYKCSPGMAVDRYRDGHKMRILISLRETKNRGDIEDFHIQRAIRDGFVREVEDFQVDIDHATRRLSMRVVFPGERTPKQVKLIEQTAQRTTELSPESLQPLPDGRWQVSWETEQPRLHEVYILRWAW